MKEFEQILDLGEGFWKENRRYSGKKIDIVRGQNIPSNSKTIDRTLYPSGIVSHKSTDVRAKSYSNPKSLYWLGMRFVNKLLEYRGEIRRDHKIGATYYLMWAVEESRVPRILEWFVPLDGISDQHKKMLKLVQIDAQKVGVEVKIILVK